VPTSNGPTSAPSQQTIAFHGDFWRRLANGRYAVADQQFENLPSSPAPAIASVAAALLVVAILAVLVQRGRPRTATIRVAPSTSSPTVVPVTSGPAELSEVAQSPPASGGGTRARTVITTFGGLHVREDGQDYASELLARPVTGLVWLRLLVGAIRDPSDRPSRDEIAKQVYPRGGRESQLKGMRNFVARGLPQMPAPLRERILVEPEVLGFKLDGCEVDAIDLLKTADQYARQPDLGSSDATRISRLLEFSQGVFLPEYERIEEIATGGHPSSSELVRQLRDQIADKRVRLGFALAEHELRSGSAGQAIAVLQRLHAERPDRKDVALRLAAAYRAAGREADASALEARYD